MIFGKRKKEEKMRREEQELIIQQLSEIQQDIKKQRMAVENLTDEWEDFREEENSQAEQIPNWKQQEANFLKLYEDYQEQLEGLKRYADSEDEKLSRQLELIEKKLEKSRQMCGISKIAGIGETVDYDLHEIIHAVETDDSRLHEVIEDTYQSGYIYKGKVRKKAKASVYRYKGKETNE
ncbi:MAG: nucleotide exchange factor GrpE [Roseburia sp.]|nr:nucleotide exchange factor GrpE [Roseburia sp.]